MTSPVIDKINKENQKKRVPNIRIGDTVTVHVKIHEGDKDRIQMFKGVVIARDGSGATETFTVRRISHGVGVERVFPVHSPNLTKIEITGSAHVRRAKLYYLRERTGKRARLRGKIRTKKDVADEKAAEAAAAAEDAAEAAAVAAAAEATTDGEVASEEKPETAAE